MEHRACLPPPPRTPPPPAGTDGPDLALEESRAFLRFIVKQDPNAIAVNDRDLRYIAVSDRYLRDYGVQAEDIRGRHRHEVFPEIPPRWKKVHRRVLAGAAERSDDCPVRPDGSVIYNRWECRPWYREDGAVGEMITYTAATTQRKLAARALRESNQRLQLAAAASNLGVWDWRVAANNLSWDDHMLEISGLAREAFLPRVKTWQAVLHPEDRARRLFNLSSDAIFLITKGQARIREVSAAARL